MKTPVAIVVLTISILLTADYAQSEKSDGFFGNFGKTSMEYIKKTRFL